MARTDGVAIKFDEASAGDIGRFILDRQVAGERGQAFFDAEAARNVPLVRRLFELPGVEAVFVAEGAVMVRKCGGATWGELRPVVERAIRREFLGHSSTHRKVDWHRPEPRLPTPDPRDGRATRERIRIPSELRWVVSWLVAGAFVAQVLWVSVWQVTDGSPAYLMRLTGTLAVLVLWVMFTRSAD